MSKIATISSLVRTAAKSEADFVRTVIAVFEEEDPERAAEFFDKMNIPRSTGAEGGLLDEIPTLTGAPIDNMWTFEHEGKIGYGIQRFLDRHERKIKWHSTHPSLEGSENVLLVFRAAMMVTNMRLERLKRIMASKDELTPQEWRTSRDLMNRSYLSFRNYLRLTGGAWIDAMQQSFSADELLERVGNFYELIDNEVRALEDYREAIEERRLELTVLPPNDLPPVKPPLYFNGDLLGRGPWKQFWANINSRAHVFRESVGY